MPLAYFVRSSHNIITFMHSFILVSIKINFWILITYSFFDMKILQCAFG